MITRIAALVATAAVAFCGIAAASEKLSTGDAERGRLLLRQYGCGTCHQIPGVATADGDVGPPLDRIARRVYLAGALPNSPDNLARFIRAPQAVKPQTLMPNLKVGEAHAADMVAYLYSLD